MDLTHITTRGYRFNVNDGWYETLQELSESSLISLDASETTEFQEGNEVADVNQVFNPSGYSNISVNDTTTTTGSMRAVTSGVGNPFKVVTNVRADSLGLLSLVNDPATLTIDHTASTTSRFDVNSYKFEFDVSTVLLAGWAVVVNRTVRQPFVNRSIIVLAGYLLRSAIPDFTVKVTGTYRHYNIPVDQFDGLDCTLDLSIRGIGFLSSFRAIDPPQFDVQQDEEEQPPVQYNPLCACQVQRRHSDSDSFEMC